MKTEMPAFNLKAKSIAYFSILDKEKSPGVIKKINATLKGASKNNLTTRLWTHTFEDNGIKKLKKAIIQSNEELIFIRSICQFNFMLIPEIFIARRRKQKVIIDVPTPNRVAIYEIWKSRLRNLTKLKYLIYLILAGPIPYWFSHRIIQYADEGLWFLLGNRSKTKVSGNGIDVDQIPFRERIPQWPNDQLRLVGVGSLNYWHGYDKLLYAMAKFNSDLATSFKVYFTIVGDGAVLNELKIICVKLNLEKFVTFTGPLTGDKLTEQYETAHVGVGSLALFRKKLTLASELKAREYCAYGIPFIAAGGDPDFPIYLPFRYVVDNSEEIDTIIHFFKSFEDFYPKIKSTEMRKFAENKLDYQIKVRQYFKGLI